MWPFKNDQKEERNIPVSSKEVLRIFGLDLSNVDTTVNTETALKVPAVWSAVSFIANSIATIPLNLYKKDGDKREKLSSDPLHLALSKRPNAEWTSTRWRKYIIKQLLLHGRCLTYIHRNLAGDVVELWPLNVADVSIEKVGFETLYTYRGGEKPIVYQGSEIIDLIFMPHDDQISHICPVLRLKETIESGLVLQAYANRFFKNGGVPPLALEGPLQSPGAIGRASEDLTKAVRAAAESKSAVLALPEGHKLSQIGYNPEQGQLIDARRFVLEEVARIYSLSPIFLQDLTHGTFSNTEQQDLHVVKHTLSHWIKAFEQELNLKILGMDESKYFEFEMDGLLRGDFKTRMEGYSKGVQNAITTPNENRKRENLPPLPGGDSLFIQQNMINPSKLSGDDNGN